MTFFQSRLSFKVDVPVVLESNEVLSPYEENRSKFTLTELQQYSGQWVAFSADGSRVVASATSLDVLEERLSAQGEDAQSLAFEHIAFEDCAIGGAELL